MPRPKTSKKNGSAELVSSANAVPVIPPANGSVAAEAGPSLATSENRTTEIQAGMPKKVRKPEILKAESRSNLLPINLDDEIRRLAYLLSERRGFEPGHETEDWLTAEREIRQRYHQQTA